jgi:phosphatidylinositol alpha-1,6-mannosyltransferase
MAPISDGMFGKEDGSAPIPMKILLTGYRFDVLGGLEIVSANLAAALVELGHEVRCAAVHDRRSTTKGGYQIIGTLPSGRIAGSLAARSRLLYPRRRIRELVAWSDLVIACHCHTLPWLAPSRLGRVHRPPVVAWLHGMEVWGGLGRGIAADLRAADRRVAVSHYTARTVAELLGPEYEPAVIHNSVDTNYFMPVVDRAEIERFTVLTVGRHDPGTENKGYDKLLEATALLRRREPGLPIKLRIVGQGALLGDLERQAAALGIRDAVDFCGAVSRDRLRQLYATCDLFAFPSRLVVRGDQVLGEGFGVVNIEAAACGRPVLTSTHGGCPETVVDGETGVSVDPTDVEAVAAGIAGMLSLSPEQRDALGRRGRERAVVEFSHSVLVRKMGGLLDGLFPDRRSTERTRDIPVA